MQTGRIAKITKILYSDVKLGVKKITSQKSLPVAVNKPLVNIDNLPISNPIVKNYYAKRSGSAKTRELLEQAQDLSLKLEHVEDGILKESIITTLMPQYKRVGQVDLSPQISALDAYHGISNRYSDLNNETHKFIKYYNKEIKPIGTMSLDIKSFEKARKLEPLKNFCNDYKSNLADYMYKEYYLRDLPLESKNTCRKIMDEFGTKLFLEHDDNHMAAKAIYKELAEWKKAGKNDAIFPNVIDCSPINELFINKKSPSGGLAWIMERFMAIKNDGHNVADVSRHEMGHINDRLYALSESQTREIIADAYKGTIDKLPSKCMKNLFTHVVEKLRVEDVAEMAEKDYSLVPTKTKEIYSKLGLPKWVFDMKPVKDMDYYG